MVSDEVLSALEQLTFSNTFNPYFQTCPVYDSEGAPALRRYYLSEMLERAAEAELDAIWVGRDLGYRGGRRTGLALTDDVHFSDHLVRWGLDVRRPTRGEPIAERTASVIWDVLLRVEKPVFLWNVFPLHPYANGDPFSNRAHNSQERKAGTAVLDMIIQRLKPKRIIAIGNDAFTALTSLASCDSVEKVRHPSYGGQGEFLSKMKLLYVDALVPRKATLFPL